MREPSFWRDITPVSNLLVPVGLVYAAAGRLRRRLVKPQAVSVPVICIGNLVAGGAGKTPVALSVGARLLERGLKVHFLSRGYGGRLKGPVRVSPEQHGAAEVGDEPLLLADMAPCWVAKDRVAGAMAAIEDGAGAIVMDDGHQNPTLEKSVSIVVIDGETGFGNGRLIPAGPMRETVAEGLARADAVAILGENRTGVTAVIPRNIPVLRGVLEPSDESREFAGKRVCAFAGIGRPEKFFATLDAMGCKIVARHGFPDHHPYSRSEIEAIVETARARDAVPVTTGKDAVRLPPDLRDAVSIVHVQIVWREPELLDRVLAKLTRNG